MKFLIPGWQGYPLRLFSLMMCWLLSVCVYTSPLYAQNKTITIKGRVTSQTGEPLPGANVVVKGTTRGVTTNVDGTFKLDVPANVSIKITYTGFISRELKVENTDMNNVSISLATDKGELNEVVVVGYGTQKRADVTGSITSINAQALRDIPAANLTSILKGQGAGIDIQKSGGNSKPGAKPTILIRGTRSLKAGNSPLFVVDGIPFNGDINDLNPDDITSVDVLKDASSTAIYGSRGANGVILVTTKRGKSGKAVVTYSGYAGFVKPSGKYDLMNARQYADLKKWAYWNGTQDQPLKYSGPDDPQILIDGFDAEERRQLAKGNSTDWQDLIYKTGIMTNHQVGISGGNEKTQFAASAGYYKETGVYPGQAFERFTVKVSVDHQINNTFKIGVSSLNNFSTTTGEGVNPMGQALRASPMAPAYDSNGVVINDFLAGSQKQIWNPLADFLPGATVEKRKRNGTFTTAYLDVNILPGLKYRFNGGAEIKSDNYGNFYSSKTTDNLGSLNTSANRYGSDVNYTLENLLTYDKHFGKHHVNFTGLYSLQESRSQSNSYNNNTLLSDELQYFNATYGLNLAGSGSESKWDIVSYMGRLNYSFKDRYLLTLTARSDGSSRLAPGNKFKGFPSAAAGWIVSNEDFMRESRVFSNLKLRASYGRTGNTAINPYQTLGALKGINYNYGSTNVTGVFINTAPNAGLQWEYTTTANFAVDFGLFNNRITGSAEVYSAQTSNLLLPLHLPGTSGIPGDVLVNVGKTQNKGVDIHLSTVNIQGKGNGDFTWTSDLNFFINRGKITELYNGIQQDISNGWFVGQPIGAFYDYQRVGIWQNNKSDSLLAQRYGQKITGNSSVIGTIRVKDVNNDSTFSDADKTIVGSPQAKWEGGMTNRFSYKGFDLTVVMYARIGSTLNSKLYGGGFANTFQGNYNNLNVPYWTPYNGENHFPKPNQSRTQTQYNATLGYFNGSYLKIRTLSLGYNVPGSFVQKLKARSLRVYVTAQDPFIFFSDYRNKYHGVDPESAGNINADTPATWSMLFGVNLTL
ncbi:TonB-linked outer membrane protein, SusC/RagA family [Chitinophaga eiseniae]|uniref:TonB-linked outer membrane protein, SusC/RagA family n=1 Tax=Chitinophaga eiseniae TaxID=634771 RepID=A0A1T4QLK5_9BACT|nr:TonB-dependent receptor [Chitinophaga eiseniae]SKA04643.1 TonB-linked outer membrane protein, SusC/RagA family [Chitinophaga eiseniae]